MGGVILNGKKFKEVLRWVARYQRQIGLVGFGAEAQARLSQSHVVVIGAGGIGSPALLYLAAAGIGNLTVIDDDVVELSNLHRQIVHSESSIGDAKVESAARELRARNSSTTIRAIRERISNQNIESYIHDADVVLDGTDNLDARQVISDACTRLELPHVWGSILGFDAQISVFWRGRGPTYTDIFPQATYTESVPNCEEAGVLGPLVGIVGTALALETVKIVGEVGQPLVGAIGYFSGLDGRWEYIELSHKEKSEKFEPTRVGSRKVQEGLWDHDFWAREMGDLGNEVGIYLDVREKEEFNSFHLPWAYNYPLSVLEREIPNELFSKLQEENQLGREITVYCSSGVRSQRAISILESKGIQGLKNLEGGINACLNTMRYENE